MDSLAGVGAFAADDDGESLGTLETLTTMMSSDAPPPPPRGGMAANEVAGGGDSGGHAGDAKTEDEDGDYVPESLVSFLKDAEAKLSETTTHILNESYGSSDVGVQGNVDNSGVDEEEDLLEEVEREERAAVFALHEQGPSPIREIPQVPQIKFGSNGEILPGSTADQDTFSERAGLPADPRDVPPTTTAQTQQQRQGPWVFFSPDTKMHDAQAENTTPTDAPVDGGDFYTPFSEHRGPFDTEAGSACRSNPAEAYRSDGEMVAAALEDESGGDSEEAEVAVVGGMIASLGTPERAARSTRGDVEAVGGSPYLGDVVEENGRNNGPPKKEDDAGAAAAGSAGADESGDSLSAYLPPSAAAPPVAAPAAAPAAAVPLLADVDDSLEAYLPPAPPPAPSPVNASIDDELFFPNRRTLLGGGGSGGAGSSSAVAKKNKTGGSVSGSVGGGSVGGGSTKKGGVAPSRKSVGAPSSRLAAGTAATRKAAAAKKKPSVAAPPSRRSVGGAALAKGGAAAAKKKPLPPPPPRTAKPKAKPLSATSSRAARSAAASSRAASASRARLAPPPPASKRRVAPAPPPPPPRAVRSTAAYSGKVVTSRTTASSSSSASVLAAKKKKPPVPRKASVPKTGGASRPSFMSPTQSTAAHNRGKGRGGTTAAKSRGSNVDVGDALAKTKARLRQKQVRERQKAAIDRLTKKKAVSPPPPPPRRVTPRAGTSAGTGLTRRRRAGATITASQVNARKGAAAMGAVGKGSATNGTAKKGEATKEMEVLAKSDDVPSTVTGNGVVNPADDSTDFGKENIATESDRADGASDAVPVQPPDAAGRSGPNITIETHVDEGDGEDGEGGPVSGLSNASSAGFAVEVDFERAKEKIDTHRSRMQAARNLEAARKPKKLASKEEMMKAALYKPFRLKKGSPTKLTVPRPPRLSTSARLGEKVLPPPSPDSDTLFTTGEKFTPHLTEPEPFHLSFMARTPSSSAAAMAPTPTLAESLDEYMRHGLRESTPRAEPFVPKLTVPKPFHLSESPVHNVPKSQAQMEEEIMAEFESRPFKAKPVAISVIAGGGVGGVPKIPKRELTAQAPFQLATDARGAHAAHPLPPTTEEMLAEECQNQFHARPMPNLSYNPPPAVPREDKAAHLTTPEPFKLRSLRRHEEAASHRPPPTPDDIEMAKQFHAKPIPASVYRRPAPRPKRDTMEGRGPTTPRGPRLSTSQRMTDTKRREMEERGFHNAEERTRERERLHKAKQRDEMREALEKASGYRTPRSKGPTVPRPFQFQSDARHEAHRAELEETMVHELEDIKRQAESFRARPAPESTRRLRPPSARKRPVPERALTEFEPFQLQSVQRHAHAQQELLAQVEAEEEERRRLAQGPKANPVPRSTHKRPPLMVTTRAAQEDLVQPVAPRLMTQKQAEHRRMFDEEARRKREAELLQKKREEEAKVAEIEREIQELRRLPVSEGGLMQVANPINSVLHGGGDYHGIGTSFQSGGSFGSVPRAISVHTPM